MDLRKILVIGASGYVGKNVCLALAANGFRVIAASRSCIGLQHPSIESVRSPDLEDASADWTRLFNGVDVAIHAAGMVHGDVDDPRHEAVNYKSILKLIAGASAAGVSRFVYISSLAAQSASFSKTVLTEDDEPKPINAYGRAKLAAERAIRQSELQYTILRPVVIYGAGAKGNLALLERLSNLRIPLPFGDLDAARSILSIDNLIGAILSVIQSSDAAFQTYLVADPIPLSVKQIVSRIRRSKKRRTLLFPIPSSLLKAVLYALNQRRAWERIGEPLVVSCDRLISIGWKPNTRSFYS